MKTINTVHANLGGALHATLPRSMGNSLQHLLLCILLNRFWRTTETPRRPHCFSETREVQLSTQTAPDQDQRQQKADHKLRQYFRGLKNTRRTNEYGFFPMLTGRGNRVDVIPAMVDGRELRIGGGAEQQQVLICKGLPREKQNLVFFQRVHTPEGYWYYSDKTTIPV